VCGIASSNKRMNQLNVKSEPCYLTDLTMDESETNKHELNIDQKNVTILNNTHQFAVPNAVPPQTIICNKNDPSSKTVKNESVIDAHELNVDEKNFCLLNTVTTKNATQSNLTLNSSTAISSLELNLDEKHSLLIDSLPNRIASSSININELNMNLKKNIPGLAEPSLLQSTKETLNSIIIAAHERNIDDKNITLFNASQLKSHQNQSKIIENQNNSGL